MLFKNVILVAALGASALALASAADATVFNVGDVPNFYITSGTPYSPSITANFGNGFSTATSFEDEFQFTIPTQSGLGSGSISTSFSSSDNKLTITDLFINDKRFDVPATTSGQSLSVSDISIFAGQLNTIRVVGTTSALGGTYSGTATFAATSAVPEAGTWAMMLCGFGVIGFGLRRQRTSVRFA